MLKIQSDRVIIDGHEPTKEQCETMTLLANALAESDKFKTVEYRDGYAEFEKVGKADELKFIAPSGNLMIYDTSGQKVYDQIVYNGDLEMTVSLQGTKITFSSGGFAFYPESDATINTADISISYEGTSWNDATKFEITLPYAPKKIRYFGGYFGEFADAAGSDYADVIINNGETITLSSENYTSGGGGAIQYYEEATPKVSVDLATLPGWSSLSSGSHSITIVAKAENYRDSEPSAAVSVEKSAGEDALAGTWVLNDALNGSISSDIKFESNNEFFSKIDCYGVGIPNGRWCKYDDIMVWEPVTTKLPEWLNDAYKTITITSKLSEVTDGETLLAWLQANATKQ